MSIQVKKKEYLEYMDMLIERELTSLDNQYKAFKKAPLNNIAAANMMQDMLEKITSFITMRNVAAASGAKDFVYYIDPATGTLNRMAPPCEAITSRVRAAIGQPEAGLPPAVLGTDDENKTDNGGKEYVG